MAGYIRGLGTPIFIVTVASSLIFKISIVDSEEIIASALETAALYFTLKSICEDYSTSMSQSTMSSVKFEQLRGVLRNSNRQWNATHCTGSEQ